MKHDLLSNKIAINFSNLSEKFLPKMSENNISKKVLQKKEIENSNLSDDSISQNLEKNREVIPIFSDFEVTGQKIMPNYPKRALKLQQDGVVYLRILVSNDGLPEEIIFTQKSQYNSLNKAALNAVSQWKFQPMIINGHKSKMWVNVPIEFKIS